MYWRLGGTPTTGQFGTSKPYRIASWRPSLNPFDISAALNLMVRDGLLKRAYTVRSPDATLAIEGPFSSPDDIPDTLHGTGDDAFQKSDGNIIPIYEEASGR